MEKEIILWDMYRGMVCGAIERAGVEYLLDCDPWQFASSLDMSFDEIKDKGVEDWHEAIRADLEEFILMSE